MIKKMFLGLTTALLFTACVMSPAPGIEQPTPIPTLTPGGSAIEALAANPVPALGGKQSGDLLVWIFSDPNPPARGDNTLEALVTDLDGQPVSDAVVSFDIDMTNMSHGKNVTTASSLGNGHYSGDLFFLMPGPWRVVVDIERGGQITTVRFDFMVKW